MTENNFSLDNTAIGIHEFYLSLIKAGFTQEQALELAKTTLLAVGKK